MNIKFIALLLVVCQFLPYSVAYDEIKLDKVQGFDIEYKEDLDSPTIASELAEENTTYIPEELIKMQYEEIFGLNSNYQKDDIQIIGGMYHYDALLKGYAYYRINAGGGCPLADISVVEAVKNNNTLTLMLQKKYGDEAQGDWQNEIITYTLLYEEETGNYIFQNVQKE